MKKINIGLDIGVASVGWSIMDEDNNILNLGVRLFDDPASSKDGSLSNKKRRDARHQRRRIRRIRHRKTRLIDFFIDNNMAKNHNDVYKIIESSISNYSKASNPVELKTIALHTKITNEELIIILFHYIHHRGYSYIDPKSTEIIDKESNDYPSIQMFDFWKKFGYYNGAKINQSFSKWDFEKEIRTILRTQEKSQEFIDSYIKLFLTNRDFSSGPGGPKSPTKYGLYRLDSNGHIKKIGDNLWTETIGKCTIYKTESRAGKYSPFAEIFNLLSDLNNLYFNFDKNSKLTYNQKRKLFNQVSDAIKKNKTKNISLGMISKICDINKENISGYNREKEITKITNTIEIAKLLFINKLLPKELDLLDINHLKIINDFFEIIRKAPSDLIKQIKLIENSEFSSIDNHQLQELLSKNIKSISETHSLSNKALVEYIQYAINGNDNQRVFFDEHFNNNMNLKNSRYISKNLVNDMIVSPTTKRTLNQTINILNKIFKLYGKKFDIGNITIEMPRDKNSYEEKKQINYLKSEKEKRAQVAKENFDAKK